MRVFVTVIFLAVLAYAIGFVLFVSERGWTRRWRSWNAAWANGF